MAKAKQQEFDAPGLKREVHKDIEKAADAYVAVRDQRMELTKSEVEKRTALAVVMEAHGLLVYRLSDDEEVVLDVKKKAKVRSLKKTDDGHDGDEDDEKE